VPVEARPGTVVFFHGYVFYSSRRNRSRDCFRMALVNHYMSAESMLPWDQDGRLPPTNDLRDIVMVAGTDPYAWKGTIDANKPTCDQKGHPRGWIRDRNDRTEPMRPFSTARLLPTSWSAKANVS